MCLALAYLCMNLAVGSFQAFDTERKIAAWGAAGFIEDENEWAALHDKVLENKNKNPIDYRHIKNHVSLLEWRIFIRRLHPKLVKEDLETALAERLKLKQMIPTSGFNWASAAEFRARLEDPGAQPAYELETAAQLDPWEDLTQRLVIRTGIRYWDSWPEETQLAITGLIDNALRIDTTLQSTPIDQFIFDAAIRYRWSDNLLRIISDDETRKRFETRLLRRGP